MYSFNCWKVTVSKYTQKTDGLQAFYNRLVWIDWDPKTDYWIRGEIEFVYSLNLDE